MAGGKLTPRQKMINMMYLVLTALLALNVSTEVLNAFRLVNEGLETSNGSLGTKNEGIYKAFQKQMETDANKAKPLYDKAQLAKQYAAELNSLLAMYKDTLVALAKGRNEEGEIEERDNIDHATALFVEERSKGANSWEYTTFNHVPVTAAVTILTKFQNDVVSSEGAIIEYLIKKIGETDFKFDALSARIISPSSYIMQGQVYKSDIFLAAFNSTQNPEIFLGPTGGFKKNAAGDYDKIDSPNELPAGYSMSMKMSGDKIKGGMGRYEVSGSGVGERGYGGIIRVKNPVGGYTFYPFDAKYQVAAKAVVVSPTKMNVLYIEMCIRDSLISPGLIQGLTR